jgi:hypothetical protein
MVVPVVMIRVKKIFRFLEERGATSAAAGVPAADVPYSDKWYFRRLIDRGVVRRAGENVYLDLEEKKAWLRNRRRIALGFCLLAIIAVLLLTARCATFTSDMKGSPGTAPAANLGADRVRVLFQFRHVHRTLGLDAIPKLEEPHERLRGFDDFFGDALRELTNVGSYATFTESSADVNDPARRALRDSLAARSDFTVRLSFMRTRSFSRLFLGSLVSTAGLTVIPVPYGNAYSVTAEVTDRDGRLVLRCERNASLTKWVQGFLIFAYPFHAEQRKKEELYVRFMHDVFRQIETEKALTRRSP